MDSAVENNVSKEVMSSTGGSFEIIGGQRLFGSIEPQGAKNEALQILCAVLLTPDKIIIDNIPDILDVNKLIELLKKMGVIVEKLAHGSYSFEAKNVDMDYLQTKEFSKLASSLRGSIMIVGPLLARYGKAHIPKPGGDKIGRRRLDTHFIGFQKLGANFDFDTTDNFFTVEAKKLKGTYMLLDEASVTGTANIVMAAVLAEGTTTIYNAACEPYLQQLCAMLNRMGAKISGIGSNLLIIEGVTSLKGTNHRILPDMIEVGSFIGLAAMTQSEITIKNVGLQHLGIIPGTFQRLGIQMEFRGDDIHIPAQEKYEIDTFIDGSI
jgi:UDP-N-acetylglucosamine 1-carboxyvinyltransferase